MTEYNRNHNWKLDATVANICSLNPYNNLCRTQEHNSMQWQCVVLLCSEFISSYLRNNGGRIQNVCRITCLEVHTLCNRLYRQFRNVNRTSMIYRRREKKNVMRLIALIKPCRCLNFHFVINQGRICSRGFKGECKHPSVFVFDEWDDFYFT